MKIFIIMTILLMMPGCAVSGVCPSSPNCVASEETGRKFVEPFSFTGEGLDEFNILKRILEDRKDTTIVRAGEDEIRVEFKTALGFVDDGLFVLERGKQLIQVRSASRTGYWDLGKNRRRLEEIRRAYLNRHQ